MRSDLDPIAMLKTELTGRSMAALAAKIGCSYQHIQAIVTGKRRPGPTVLKYLGLKKGVRYTRADD